MSDPSSSIPVTGPSLSLEELLAFIAGCKRKSVTLGYLEYVLSELGCSKRVTSIYNDRSLLDLTTVIMGGFNPPEHVPPEVIQSGLATICDAYARRKHQSNDDNHRIAMVFALSQNDNWRACLGPKHCPHSFAMNTLIALRRANTLALEIVAMLNAWLTPGRSAIVLEDPPWIGSVQREDDILAAMFGEHWLMFCGDLTEGWRDLTIIMRDKPVFMPGLLPIMGAVTASASLPEFG